MTELYWSRDIRDVDKTYPEFRRGHFSWNRENDQLRQWQTNFQCDPLDDLSQHALEPITAMINEAVTMVHGFWEDRAISAAQSLIRLWVLVSADGSVEELFEAFQVAIEIARRGFPPTGAEARRNYRTIVVRTLRDHGARLTTAHNAALREQLGSDTYEPDEHDDLVALVNDILGMPHLRERS